MGIAIALRTTGLPCRTLREGERAACVGRTFCGPAKDAKPPRGAPTARPRVNAGFAPLGICLYAARPPKEPAATIDPPAANLAFRGT